MSCISPLPWAIAFALSTLITLRAQELPNLTEHCGTCDASAIIQLNDRYFVVASDEDNILRVYEMNGARAPVQQLDLSSFLHHDGKPEEADIEGAARIGNTIFWITSHGRNAKGKARPGRRLFFATTADLPLRPLGQPYPHLLDDLVTHPSLARYNLAGASVRAPKEPGALNIEGLSETPEGHLLIGLRNPLPEGKALIVPLLNPLAVLDGRRAQLGQPSLLDLGGLGIRSLAWHREQYWIVAGPYDGEGTSQLFRWDGSDPAPIPVPGIDFRGLNPEAITFRDAGVVDVVQILSDDGTVMTERGPCKGLSDPNARTFRSLTLKLPAGGPLNRVSFLPGDPEKSIASAAVQEIVPPRHSSTYLRR